VVQARSVPSLRRPRVLALLAVLAVVVAVMAVALARSRTPGCAVGAPDVTLPAQLRTLGGFDQPFPAGDSPALLDASVTAGAALHSDLAGATAPLGAVRETASGGATHDALVVPLSEASGGDRRIVGLVAFLLDCGGRAYYDDVDDLLHDPSSLVAAFPRLSEETAAAALGTGDPLRLVWQTSPFHPLWLDPTTGRTVAAGPPG
jgi:hypothetical protein